MKKYGSLIRLICDSSQTLWFTLIVIISSNTYSQIVLDRSFIFCKTGTVFYHLISLCFSGKTLFWWTTRWFTGRMPRQLLMRNWSWANTVSRATSTIKIQPRRSTVIWSSLELPGIKATLYLSGYFQFVLEWVLSVCSLLSKWNFWRLCFLGFHIYGIIWLIAK